MKTLYVYGTRGFPRVQGGVEKHCEYLYSELSHTYKIYVFRRKTFLPMQRSKKENNINFIDLPSTRIKGFEAVYHSFICTLYCIFKRPSLIHIHNIGPGLFIPLLKLFRLHVVLTYHSPNYEHQKWGLVARKILKLSEYLSTRWADKIIFVNKYQMLSAKAGIQKKSVFIPNGVHTNHPISETGYITQLGLTKDKYILTVGRITQEKGWDYLIEAFITCKQPDYQLVLAGGIDHSSNYTCNLLTKIQSHTHIVTTGYVDGKNLQELYSHARLFVLPSYNEGFPLVLLEAMSYNLPILASDIEANKLVSLPDDDYFHTGDTSDLAHQLTRILSSQKTVSQYDLKQYTWEYVATQTATVYSGII